jgi:hypothetical protein
MAPRRHPRQLIREAAKVVLVGTAPAFLTAAGDRVFETRIIPYRKRELPAIALYTLTEPIDQAGSNTAPRKLKRQLSLMIEAAAAVPAEGTIDDVLDELALEIEIAMHREDTLGGLVSDLMLASTEMDVAGEGENLLGVLRLTYSVTYYTDAPDSRDSELDEFQSANIRHKLNNLVEEANEAVDELTGIHQGEED